MNKNIIINQIMADYGMTRKEADKFYRRIDNDMKEEFYKEAMQTSRNTFYND